jgi:hypothetical protein
MTFEEAKEILGRCERLESRDHYFGDREVYWVLDDRDVADGYFGGGTASVYINAEDDSDRGEFHGEEARELAKCGAKVTIGRNDEVGPDEYRGA